MSENIEVQALNKLIKEKKIAAAIKLAAALLRDDPYKKGIRYTLCRLLELSKASEKAIQHYELLLHQEPQNINYRLRFARLLSQEKKISKLGAVLHGLVHLKPTDTQFGLLLAGLYGSMGKEAASRDLGLAVASRDRISLLKKIDKSKIQVLVLSSAASGGLRLDFEKFRHQTVEGHNNVVGLLDPNHTQVTRFFVDAIPQNFDSRLLSHIDVIYCSITDAERGAEALKDAARICDQLKKPIINNPRNILASSREGNFERVGGRGSVFIPKSIKVEGLKSDFVSVLEFHIEKNEMKFPLLVRVAGYQNGKFMQKINNLNDIDDTDLKAIAKTSPLTLYIIEYVEFGRPFGDNVLYQKHRAFLVGKELIPAHTRYGLNTWNVHMPEHKPTIRSLPWLYADEEEYLIDPEKKIGAILWGELRNVMLGSGLDYCGVDFAVTEYYGQKRIVIFEANPAMRNFLDQQYKGTPGHKVSKRAAMAINEVVHRKSGRNIKDFSANLDIGVEFKSKFAYKNFIHGEIITASMQIISKDRPLVELETVPWLWHVLRAHNISGIFNEVAPNLTTLTIKCTVGFLEFLQSAKSCEEWDKEVFDFSWQKLAEVDIGDGVFFVGRPGQALS